jgi:glycosyltransferase involved in cell wall biosynthesis
MLISIVIPNYNDIRIERTLKSIYSQNIKDFEVIVVDACSNEKVQEIYKNFPINKLIVEKDHGIFDALNKGIQNVEGDVIYLMGSDDYLPNNNTLFDVIQQFENNKLLDGVCIGCEFINNKGEIIRKWYPNSVNSKKIKLGIFPPHFSLFIKKDVYNKTGLFQFKEFKNVACDIFWLLDLAIIYPNFNIKVLKNHLIIMEYGGSSTGSYKAVIKQFLLVFKYAWRKSNHLPFWFLLSPIRTSSKIFQFKF